MWRQEVRQERDARLGNCHNLGTFALVVSCLPEPEEFAFGQQQFAFGECLEHYFEPIPVSR